MSSNIKKDDDAVDYYNTIYTQDQVFLQAPTFANQAASASAFLTPHGTPGKKERRTVMNTHSNPKSSNMGNLGADHDSPAISENYVDEQIAFRKKADEQNSQYDTFMDFERDSDRPSRGSGRADVPKKKSKGIASFFKNSLNKFKKKKP